MWNQRLVQLTPAQRERVARLYAEGVNMTAIAVRCGVSVATISRALEKQKPAKSER